MEEPITSEGTMLVQPINGRHRVSIKYPNGSEVIEEYSLSTGKLEVRKWMARNSLGRSTGWIYEIGTGDQVLKQPDGDGCLLKPSHVNPVFVATDHPAAFEWRIRNIPYPLSTYQLTVDEDKQEIILRTTNKKYFKRFRIPALRRHQLQINKQFIAINHAHNTLVIRYKKPSQILQYEKLHKERIKKSNLNSGSAGCETQ